jgi:hypothetical protein
MLNVVQRVEKLHAQRKPQSEKAQACFLRAAKEMHGAI